MLLVGNSVGAEIWWVTAGAIGPKAAASGGSEYHRAVFCAPMSGMHFVGL